jgi:hypothetical protein
MTAFNARKGAASKPEEDRALMCSAHNCPNRWSVQREGERGLCSAHAWVKDKRAWPRITDELLTAQTERARYAEPAPEEQPQVMTRADKLDLLARLSGVLQRAVRHPHRWAHNLRRRYDAGERLNQAQRECLREFEKRQSGVSDPAQDAAP